MDNYDFETYLEIDSEIEKLRNLANTFGKKVRTDSIRPHQLSVFIDLDKYFRAIIYFNFSLRGKFPTAYYLAFQQRRNADGFYGTIYPKRHLVPEQILNIGEYHSDHYSISKGDSISDAGNVVIHMGSSVIYDPWTSAFGICPCRYRPTVNLSMNRQHRCRHAVSGFLRLRSGGQQQEGCAEIHQPAPTAQIVR